MAFARSAVTLNWKGRSMNKRFRRPSADLRRPISADLVQNSADLRRPAENLPLTSADRSAEKFPLTFRRPTADLPLTSADLSADLPPPYRGDLSGASRPPLNGGSHA